MPLLAQYHLQDGLIRGVWSAHNVETLAAQVTANDPVYGYLVLGDQDVQVLQEQYVVLAGQLTAKPLVTLSAFPSPFAADGVTVCTVTVTPFVPCTVLVNATPYALVLDDRHVLVTSDTPMHFALSLPHQAACWGAPITVEAA